MSLLSATREAVLRWLELMPNTRAFVIVSDHNDAIRIAARIRARVLQLPNAEHLIPKTEIAPTRARTRG
jgi:hypothetical protein